MNGWNWRQKTKKMKNDYFFTEFLRIDVIAEDKKLIEGYVAIIKDMAIRYGAKIA